MVVAIISQAKSAGGRVRDTQMRKIKTGRKQKKREIREIIEESNNRGRSSLGNAIKWVRLDRFKKTEDNLLDPSFVLLFGFFFKSLSFLGNEFSYAALCCPSNIIFNFHIILELSSLSFLLEFDFKQKC